MANRKDKTTHQKRRTVVTHGAICTMESEGECPWCEVSVPDDSDTIVTGDEEDTYGDT
jgi:hypothetical protein